MLLFSRNQSQDSEDIRKLQNTSITNIYHPLPPPPYRKRRVQITNIKLQGVL